MRPPAGWLWDGAWRLERVDGSLLSTRPARAFASGGERGRDAGDDFADDGWVYGTTFSGLFARQSLRARDHRAGLGGAGGVGGRLASHAAALSEGASAVVGEVVVRAGYADVCRQRKWARRLALAPGSAGASGHGLWTVVTCAPASLQLFVAQCGADGALRVEVFENQRRVSRRRRRRSARDARAEGVSLRPRSFRAL